MKNTPTVKLAKAAVIAALYATITVCFAPLSYGAVQFRIAECLCVLAFFYDEAILGLTLGCFIANFFGNGIFDIIFGTAATFIASTLSRLFAKKISNTTVRFFVCSIFPIIINALIIPLTIVPFTQDLGYGLCAVQIFIGQAVVILSLGALLFFTLNKIVFQKE